MNAHAVKIEQKNNSYVRAREKSAEVKFAIYFASYSMWPRHLASGTGVKALAAVGAILAVHEQAGEGAGR